MKKTSKVSLGCPCSKHAMAWTLPLLILQIINMNSNAGKKSVQLTLPSSVRRFKQALEPRFPSSLLPAPFPFPLAVLIPSIAEGTQGVGLGVCIRSHGLPRQGEE